MLAITSTAGSVREKPSVVVRRMASRLPWAWHGLCFGVAGYDAGVEGLRDIVNNVPRSSETGVTWIKDNRGNPVPHVFGYVQYPNHPQHDQPDRELTAYVRVRIIGPNLMGTGALCYPHTADVSPWMTWGITHDTANLDKVTGMVTVDGTPAQLGDSAVITHSRYTSIFLRWRSGGAPQLDAWDERGNLISSVVYGSAVTGSLTYAAGQGIRVNCTDDTAAQGDGNYSQFMVWSRRLTDAEALALVADPYGWYSPRRETVGLSGVFALPGYREPEWTFGQVVQVG